MADLDTLRTLAGKLKQGAGYLSVDTINEASDAIIELLDALAATEQPLEHASQCLDGIVSMDDEDQGKNGGSATCQAVKKTVDRALKQVRAALSAHHP